jgi:hypothetical protein
LAALISPRTSHSRLSQYSKVPRQVPKSPRCADKSHSAGCKSTSEFGKASPRCVLGFRNEAAWNVAEMEPLIGIYTALTRQGLDGEPEGGWVPEQTIDLETAIRAYTINGAYANSVEQNRGSVTSGK